MASKSKIDPIYKKYAAKVIKNIMTTDFYEYFMDVVSSGKNRFQFSNRRIEKQVDDTWVVAIENCIKPFEEIINNPRNFIMREEIIVNIALAKKVTPEAVRHLAQHGDMIDDWNDEKNEIRPNKLQETVKEDSWNTYENRFVYTLLEMTWEFVDKRYEAIFAAMNEEFGAYLKMEGEANSYQEALKYNVDLRIQQQDDILSADEKNETIFARIARLHRILGAYRASAFAKEMKKYAKVKPPLVPTNAIKKNPNFKACHKLWNFILSYEDIGYKIEIYEQSNEIDESFATDIFNSVFFDYIILKNHLELAEDREIDTSRQFKKKSLKPKYIKEIIEEIVKNYDLPDIEIRKVLIEEMTKAELMQEEEKERRRLVEEKEREMEEKRLLEEKEAKERAKEEERERKRLEKERIAEEKRKEKERLAEEKRIQKEAEQAKAEEEAKAARYEALFKQMEADRTAILERRSVERDNQKRQLEAEKLKLQKIKEAEAEKKRLAEEKAAEKARLKAEAEAEKKRIAEEKAAAKAKADAEKAKAKEQAKAAAEKEKAKAKALADKEKAKAAAEKAKAKEKVKAAAEKAKAKEKVKAAAEKEKARAKALADKEKAKAAAEKAKAKEKAKAEAEKEKAKAKAEAEKQRLAEEKAAEKAKAEAERAAAKAKAEEEKAFNKAKLAAEKEEAKLKALAEKARLKAEAQAARELEKERIAKEKEEEKARVAAEKEAERLRIAKEKDKAKAAAEKEKAKAKAEAEKEKAKAKAAAEKEKEKAKAKVAAEKAKEKAKAKAEAEKLKAREAQLKAEEKARLAKEKAEAKAKEKEELKAAAELTKDVGDEFIADTSKSKNSSAKAAKQLEETVKDVEIRTLNKINTTLPSAVASKTANPQNSDDERYSPDNLESDSSTIKEVKSSSYFVDLTRINAPTFTGRAIENIRENHSNAKSEQVTSKFLKDIIDNSIINPLDPEDIKKISEDISVNVEDTSKQIASVEKKPEQNSEESGGFFRNLFRRK